MTKYYKLADRPNNTLDLVPLGLTYKDVSGPLTSIGMGVSLRNSQGKLKLMAKRIGQFRPPKAGEWYLSGGPGMAWRAPNDLNTAFHILKLVIVRKVETLVEE